MKSKNECTLKEQKDWIASCISLKMASKIKEIHFVKNLPSDIKKIAKEWDPTVEQNGGAKCVLTQDDILYISLEGKETIFANKDSYRMFSQFHNVELIDGLELIDTSNVEDFAFAFCDCGQSANTFIVRGMEEWDLSNTTDVCSMFSNAGTYKAKKFDIGDLSKWNTVNVKDMNSMFSSAGSNAEEWYAGDLSNWNTKNAIDMCFMFYQAGYEANEWSVGLLNNWDVSNVRNMSHMFAEAGYKSKTFTLDISSWNPQKAKNVCSMFFCTAYLATSFSVGNLSKWQLPNVREADHMFYFAGNKADWHLNLEGWDCTNSSHQDFQFGSKIKEPAWVR